MTKHEQVQFEIGLAQNDEGEQVVLMTFYPKVDRMALTRSNAMIIANQLIESGQFL